MLGLLEIIFGVLEIICGKRNGSCQDKKASREAGRYADLYEEECRREHMTNFTDKMYNYYH